LSPPVLLAIGVLAASLPPAVFFGAADFEDDVLLLELEEPDAVDLALFEAEPLELFAAPDFDAEPVLLEVELDDFDEVPELLDDDPDDFADVPELLDEPDAALDEEPLDELEEPLDEPEDFPLLLDPDDLVVPAAIFEVDDADRDLAELPDSGAPVTDSITDTAAPVTAPAAAPASTSVTASFVLS